MLKKKLVTWGIAVLAVIILINVFFFKPFRNDIDRNIEDLKSSDVNLRNKAIKNLVRIGKPAIEPLVFAAKYNPVHTTSGIYNSYRGRIKTQQFRDLSDNTMTESRNLKCGVARALGEIGDTAAIGPLIDLLRDPGNDVVDAASDALAKFGKPAVEPLIKRYNEDSDACAIALGKIGDERAVDVIMKSLYDGPNYVGFSEANRAKFEALRKLGVPAAKALIRDIKKEGDCFLDGQEICALSGMDSREVIDLLVKELEKEYDPRLYSALVDMENPYATISLLNLMRSDNPAKEQMRELFFDYAALPKVFKNLIYIKAIRESEDMSYPGKCAQAVSSLESDITKGIDDLIFNESRNRTYGFQASNRDVLLQLFKDCEMVVRLEVLNLVKPENWPLFFIGGETEIYRELRKNFYSALSDKDPIIREAAIADLNCDDAGYVSSVTECLRDKNPEIRLTAARSLLRVMKPADFDVLLRSLVGWGIFGNSEKDLITRCRSDNRELEKLISQYEKGDEASRLKTVALLGEIGGKRAVDALTSALKDDNRDVVKEAANSLGYMGDKRAVLPLCDALKTGNEDVKAEIISSLALLRDGRAVDSLVKILEGRDLEAKVLAIRALGIIGDRKAVLPLCKFLEDGHFNYKILVEILGDMGDKRAVPYLVKAAVLGDEEMEAQVIRSLAKLKDKRALPVLKRDLMSKSYIIRRESIKALKQVWDASAVDALGRRLMEIQNFDYESAMIFIALSEMTGSQVSDVLLKALKHKDEETRRMAVTVLGNRGEKRVVKALVKMLASDGGNRKAIAIALGKLKDPEAVVPLINSFRDGTQSEDEIVNALYELREYSVPELKKAEKSDNWEISSGAARALECIRNNRRVSQ